MMTPMIAWIKVFFAFRTFCSLPKDVIQVKPLYKTKIRKIIPKRDKNTLIMEPIISTILLGTQEPLGSQNPAARAVISKYFIIISCIDSLIYLLSSRVPQQRDVALPAGRQGSRDCHVAHSVRSSQ
jgi:hypothetical protein